MEHNMLPLRAVLIALFALLAWAGSTAHAAPTREVDRIVAVVNDEVITLYELKSRVAQAERQLKAQQVQLPPADILEKQMLERMITDRVQIQMAKETSVRVDDLTLERAIGRIAESNRMSPGDFRAALEKDGISWSKFREEVRNEMTVVRLREREVDSRIQVSDAEIDNFLANGDRPGAGNEQFLVSHILLRAPDQAGPEQLQRLQAKAQDIVAQLKAGADFAKLAASYSDAPDALTGGSLGWRGADRMPSLFAETVAGMQPGQVSGVIRSPAGMHIVKLVERKGGSAAGQKSQQTNVRHILIKTNELVGDAEARRRLVALKERIDNGTDFAELARLNSNDLSAAKGGDLGWIYPGDTVPEFERAMDALKPGQVSEPIQSPFGWHLIQVVDRRVDEASDERKRQIARQALRERKAEEAYEDWVRQQRDRAYVEYRLEDK